MHKRRTCAICGRGCGKAGFLWQLALLAHAPLRPSFVGGRLLLCLAHGRPRSRRGVHHTLFSHGHPVQRRSRWPRGKHACLCKIVPDLQHLIGNAAEADALCRSGGDEAAATPGLAPSTRRRGQVDDWSARGPRLRGRTPLNEAPFKRVREAVGFQRCGGCDGGAPLGVPLLPVRQAIRFDTDLPRSRPRLSKHSTRPSLLVTRSDRRRNHCRGNAGFRAVWGGCVWGCGCINLVAGAGSLRPCAGRAVGGGSSKSSR